MPKPNTDFSIFAQLDRNDEMRYPVATVSNLDESVFLITNLTPMSISLGTYGADISLSKLGVYSIKYEVFDDISHTIPSKRYKLGSESVTISDLEQNVEDMLSGNYIAPLADFGQVV